jgi:4-diphosphocytidyl-2-C-methyl-D-erythritol kinase
LLDSFVTSLDLHNLVTVKKRKDTLVVGKMKGMGMDAVPFEKTTACKVAEAFKDKFGTTGAEIVIYENIPVGAGLGGSSADAAGVLRALCKLYGVAIEEVYEIANKYGSDVRYMLEGGFARMRGKGELVDGLQEKSRLHFFLLCPNTPVSAGECYRKYDELELAPSSATEKAVQAYYSGDLEELGRLLSNDLFEPAKALNADLGRAYEELSSFSPLGVCMTGSGSCVFALFETKELCEWAKSRYKGAFRAIVSSSKSGGFEKTVKNPFAL